MAVATLTPVESLRERNQREAIEVLRRNGIDTRGMGVDWREPVPEPTDTRQIPQWQRHAEAIQVLASLPSRTREEEERAESEGLKRWRTSYEFRSRPDAVEMCQEDRCNVEPLNAAEEVQLAEAVATYTERISQGRWTLTKLGKLMRK